MYMCMFMCICMCMCTCAYSTGRRCMRMRRYVRMHALHRSYVNENHSKLVCIGCIYRIDCIGLKWFGFVGPRNGPMPTLVGLLWFPWFRRPDVKHSDGNQSFRRLNTKQSDKQLIG